MNLGQKQYSLISPKVERCVVVAEVSWGTDLQLIWFLLGLNRVALGDDNSSLGFSLLPSGLEIDTSMSRVGYEGGKEWRVGNHKYEKTI